jgi:hypothetical protein
MKIKLLLLLSALSFSGFSQTDPADVIHRFFQAMSDIDTSYLNEVLMDNASLSSTFLFDDNNPIGAGTKDQFIQSIVRSKVGELDEQVCNLKVDFDGGLANVCMDYTFYYKGELSHCGVNNFVMVIDGISWKIISLADSRRDTACISHDAKLAINEMLDNWHRGASNADSISYFDLMAINSVYVGTDETEVWSKRKFLNFAAPYFAKGKAWAFTKVERNVYSKDYIDIAWFDEVLDTWMGPCRGSGVVTKDDDEGWKVQHYVLSVAVANDDIDEYLKVIGKERK